MFLHRNKSEQWKQWTWWDFLVKKYKRNRACKSCHDDHPYGFLSTTIQEIGNRVINIPLVIDYHSTIGLVKLYLLRDVRSQGHCYIIPLR